MPVFSPAAGFRRTFVGSGFRARLGGLVLAVMAATGVVPAAVAQDTSSAGPPADVAAIRAAATAYRAALAAGDEAAIRAAWTADGDIVDGWGNRLLARDPAALTGTPSTEPRPEFRFGESHLRFITPDVAVEDGTVDAILPGMETPIEGWFSAVWVRQDAAWKLASLRESERPLPADADMLADLGWMVGDWKLVVDAPHVDRPQGAEQPAAPAMEMRVRWDAGHAFLIRDARVPVAGAAGFVEVHQRIGWDPLVRRIRSWSFSTDGSRGEATWFRDGDSWVAVRTAVLPTGRQETAVNIYSYDGSDRCVWRMLPDGLETDDGRPTKATWIRTSKGNAE